MPFHVEEFSAEAGWVAVRRDVPDGERDALEAANVDLMHTGSESPAVGAVRVVEVQ